MRGYNTIIHQDENDERMCFLPLCHVAERVGGEYFAIYTGSILNFVENPETVPENVREIAPTVFTAVPRIWEKFYSSVVIAVRESGRAQQAAYAWAIGVGGRVADRVLAGQPVGTALKWQFALARRLALDNVRKLIGIHRARFCVTGAAPISPDLVRWYLALGVPMVEVWGMTESCGAATVHAGDADQAGNDRAGVPVQRSQARSGDRRAADPRHERLHGLPQPAREDRRDDRCRRLAAHRRRRHRRTATGISGSPIA